jgi:hypothetical protein
MFISLKFTSTDVAEVNINRASSRLAIFVLNANELVLRILKDIANSDGITLTLAIAIIKHIGAKLNIATIFTILAHKGTSFSWFL